MARSELFISLAEEVAYMRMQLDEQIEEIKTHYERGIMRVSCLKRRVERMDRLLQDIAYDAPKSGRYVLNENGTASDTQTGLMWMRCAIGQRWDGTTCVGEPETFNWEEACKQTSNFAGYNDWRLPTIDELKEIIDRSQSGAKIHPQAFPNCPASFFWSSSAYADDSGSAWGVGFKYGYDGDNYRSYGSHVRLVRGGQ